MIKSQCATATGKVHSGVTRAISGFLTFGLAAWASLSCLNAADAKPKKPSVDAPTKIKNPKEVKVRLKQIKGLLVSDLGNDMAGIASTMTVTATRVGSKDEQMSVRFNQPVGKDMSTALGSVMRALSVRYESLPPGYEATISFEDKYTPKDGPSAAVACTLLLDGLITGIEYDERFAVTGDMNADMSVQPVGGVDAKIRGAAKKKCTIVAIPDANKSTIMDLAVLGEFKPIYDIQVFNISTYDEALALASTKRPADLQKSIDEFASVQRALMGKGDRLLTNAKVISRLKGIVRRTPNHLSARVLVLAGTRRLPKTLSLRGSFVQMSRASAPFFQSLAADSDGGGLDEDLFANTLFKMKQLRTRLDSRTRQYQDSVTDLVTLWRSYAARDVRGKQQFETAKSKFDAAYGRLKKESEALRRNREIAEEMMK